MRLVIVSCALVCALAPLPAHANPEAAKALADEASKLAAANQMIAAAAKFREAYATDPRPEYVCNVGVAYLKAPDLPRAQRYLNDCTQLGNSLDKAFLANVKKVMETVEAKLVAGDFTPVDVFVDPAGATVAVEGGVPFDEPIVGSRRVWFPYGNYKLVVHAEGYTDRVVDVAAAADAAVRVTAKLDKATEIKPPIEPIVKPPIEPIVKPPIEPIVKPPPVPPGPEAPSKTPAVVATIATGVVGLAAGALYLRAYSKRNKANDTVAGTAFDDLESQYKSALTGSRICGGLAVIGASVSGYLWYKATRSTTTQVEVQTSATGATVLVGGSF